MKLIVDKPETLRIENLNHPDDFYLFFEGGELIWNRSEDKDLCIQLGPDPSNVFSIARFTLPFHAIRIVRNEVEQHKKSLAKEASNV